MKTSEFNAYNRRDPYEPGRDRVLLGSHRVTRPKHDGLKSAAYMRELSTQPVVVWGKPEYL